VHQGKRRICTLTDVKAFAYAARTHWGIENSSYWALDVTFRENDSRIRKGYAPKNVNIIRQRTINLLKKGVSKPYCVINLAKK